MPKDLETRIPRGFSGCVEVLSCSRRGREFLKNWIDDDDEPTPTGDGRHAVFLLRADASKLLTDAARDGLEF
jgi:hypothetical protein